MSDATSVVTVITKDDISRWGARTLDEILKRVPGFMPSRQPTWSLVGSRGMTGDGSENILLLVDGHAQNSILANGFQQQNLAPVLEKVERIEIVRGAGSVLWGSSAVSGIINIITQDGTKGSGDRVTAGYGNRDGLITSNYMSTWENAAAGTSGVVSASVWKSNGYNRPNRTKNLVQWGGPYGGEIRSNIGFSSSFMDAQLGPWTPLDRQEGYEFYYKGSSDKNTHFLARVFDMTQPDPWSNPWWPGSLRTAEGIIKLRKAYGEVQRTLEVSPSFSVDTTLYGDFTTQNRGFPRYQITRDMNSVTPDGNHNFYDISNEEMSFGAEVMGTWAVTEQNSMKIGLKGIRTDLGPNRTGMFDPTTNLEISSTTDYATLAYLSVPSGPDNTVSVYVEDIQKFNGGKTTVFSGGRYEYNDYRDAGAIFIPRGGVIQKLTDEFAVKYIVNTGYLRPALTYSKDMSLLPSNRAKRPIRSINNDLQFVWDDGRNYGTLTAYYTRIKNMVLPLIGGVNGYSGDGTNESKGIELEGKSRINRSLDVYGNYSYCLAHLNSRTGGVPSYAVNSENQVNAYPVSQYNVGTDWLLNKDVSLNVHVNGWNRMPIASPVGEEQQPYMTLKGEYYVDTAFVVKNIGRRLDVTVFADNVLNNTHRVGMLGGVYYPRGQELGMTVSLTF